MNRCLFDRIICSFPGSFFVALQIEQGCAETSANGIKPYLLCPCFLRELPVFKNSFLHSPFNVQPRAHKQDSSWSMRHNSPLDEYS